MIGKWHLTPSSQETAAGPYDRWPLGRGFERFYGFLGGDTSQWYPELVYDNHQVEPPRTPEEGYHLTEDLVDKAIEFIADAKQVDPDKPFYLHFCSGATHAPHHVAEGVGRPVRRARSTTAGTPTARRSSRGRRSSASSRPTRSSRATTPTCPSGTRCPADAAPAVQPDDGGLRRLPRATPTTTSAGCSTTCGRLGELDNTLIMVISDNGASAEGGPTGTTNEAQFFNNAPESFEDSLARDRRDRRPEVLQPLPVGLDVGRQHAVPALEARDLPRRLVRPVHRVAGRRASAARRGARRSTRTSSTWCRPCSTLLGIEPPPTIRGVTQSPLHGVSFAAHLRRRGRAEPAPHPVLRDDRPPVDLPRRLAGGVPVAGPVVRRGRHGVRRADLRGDARPSSTRPAGSCTTSPRTSPRTTNSPTSTATG